MRRLVVKCSCGERIQVPQSALGKTGLCPSCGSTIYISRDNAAPFRHTAEPPRQSPAPGRKWDSGGQEAPPDIRRRFAEGVDLYFAKRYSEALVIFNVLAAAMPHDADIQMGQSMCMNALRKISPFGLGQDSFAGQLPAPPISEERSDAILNGPTPTLDADFFKRFLFDKMLHGANDEIQMRAAELAAKMFGLLDTAGAPEPKTADPEPRAANIEELFDDEKDETPVHTTPFRRAAAPHDIDR